MNPNTLIFVLSGAILISYLFDLIGSKTRLPSVVLLLFTGIFLRMLADWGFFSLPEMESMLPALGTIGLILIVLEGAMDLSVSREKIGVIRQTMLSAGVQISVQIGIIALIFSFLTNAPLLQTLLNAVPLGVVSSAVAIPSARNLSPDRREFVIYESAFSDILGIFLFNFLLVSIESGRLAVGRFGLDLLLTVLLSVASCLILALLLQNIRHKVKFLPIISLLLLVYALAKMWHLSGLLMVLLFGLFINNTDLLRLTRLPERMLKNDNLKNELPLFKNIISEVTFVARTFFFLLFGYTVHASQLFENESLTLAGLIISAIFLVRLAYFFVAKGSLPKSLIFVSPRGLITILLFLSIPVQWRLPELSNVVLMLVVLFSALLLTAGLVFFRK